MNRIKTVAKSFVYQDPTPAEFGFLIHPYFQNTLFYHPENKEFLDITMPENLEEARKYYCTLIDRTENMEHLIWMIRKPYRMAFLKYIKKYCDKNTFSRFLGEIWTESENPNMDVNVPLTEMIRFFQEANKEVLMNVEEYEYFKTLPETMTLYRGVANGRVRDGLSWTQDKKIAEWFMNRFNTENSVGYLLEATVTKEDILAYFSRRGEEELVVNIKNIKKRRTKKC